MQVATKKKIRRPKNMANSLNGQMSMWTTEEDGVRRAHIRCPHCDRVATLTRSGVRSRWKWLRAAGAWMRRGSRRFL